MTSVVQRALGDAFADLHPKVQWRFGLSAADGKCQYGVGVMEEMTHSKLIPPPVLWVGGKRGLFPAGTGTGVPFTITNYAYTDELGRETMSFVRRFQFVGREQGMNSVMVTPLSGGDPLDYLGFSPDMAVHTTCSVDEDGGLVLASGPPRFLLGRVAPTPPQFASALTTGREWWDSAEQRHRIDIEVTSPLLGRLFHYRGWFTAEEQDCLPADVPADAYPSRTEHRE